MPVVVTGVDPSSRSNSVPGTKKRSPSVAAAGVDKLTHSDTPRTTLSECRFHRYRCRVGGAKPWHNLKQNKQSRGRAMHHRDRFGRHMAFWFSWQAQWQGCLCGRPFAIQNGWKIMRQKTRLTWNFRVTLENYLNENQDSSYVCMSTNKRASISFYP